MAAKIAFAVLLLVTASFARRIGTKHEKQEKSRKYAVPYPQPVAIQGMTYPDCGGSPCVSHGAYQSSYPSSYQPSSSHCCPTGDSSCCGQQQSPPCCLTIQPYGSKEITVDAPSKVTLQINILPVEDKSKSTTAKPSTAKPSTAKPTTPATTPTAAPTPPTQPTPAPAPAPPAPGLPAPPAPAPPVRDVAEANVMHDFLTEALDESNRERAVHLTNEFDDGLNNLGNNLVLDAGLNIAAQRYAQKIAHERKPAHSDPASRPTQGENIAVACNNIGKPLSGKTAAHMWYNEVKHYNWNVPGYTAKTGHFSQAVWKGSKKVGFGRSKYLNDKGKSCFVVVARYAPRGNIKGQFPHNVAKGDYIQI